MKARIYLLQRAETIIERIISRLEKLRERCAVCPDCGRNRYTGKPCI